MKYSRLLRREGGYLSVLAILLIMMVGFLGSTLSYLFTDTSNATLNSFLANKAYYIAQAGTEQASRYVLAKGVACGNVTGNSDLTNASFGGGEFTVTGVANVVNTTLSGSIANTDTSITLTSTAGFANQGVISIDTEVISYTGLSGNSLVGVARGMFTTTAASHTTGAAVSQNQCTLDSIAGVPNLTSPLAKSEVIKVIPLFTSLGGAGGWAVGNASGGNYTLAYWNSSSWTPSSVPTASSATAAYAVAMPAVSDAWFVGDKSNFYRWNGSTWTLSSVTPTTTFRGMSCGSGGDCHAVTDRLNANNPGLFDWTSAGGWSRNTGATGSVNGTNLKAVSCTSATNCWAVGDNSGGSIFYRWTGSWRGYTVSLSGFPFHGVFCNSTSDCWAVGESSRFARYNGSTWSDFETGLSGKYYSVFCTNSNDCWAVGQVNSSKDLIMHWNGSSWTRDSSNPTPIADLNGVACLSANNCWAVGASKSGNNPTFVQYNGTSWQNVTVSGMPSGAPLNALAFNGSGGSVTIPSNAAIVIQEFA